MFSKHHYLKQSRERDYLRVLVTLSVHGICNRPFVCKELGTCMQLEIFARDVTTVCSGSLH